VKVRNQPYLEAFGKNLKKVMHAKGVTAEDVAAIGHLETKQVYRVMKGEHSVTLSILYAIAKGLEMPLKNLFNFEFNEKEK
jgi:transcriptional regulator with XRE-family HTH domain